MVINERLIDVAEGGMKVAPVLGASWWSTMSPNELAGFITAIVGGIYGLVMLAYLLRKWQREEVLFKESMQVLKRGSKRKVAEKINAVTI